MGTAFICFCTAPDSMRRPASGTSVTVGGTSTTVRFRARKGFSREDQIDAQLPGSLAGAGSVTVTVTINGATANPVTIAFQ
jgi:uncharacterized protein (TIGR03437 family)